MDQVSSAIVQAATKLHIAEVLLYGTSYAMCISAWIIFVLFIACLLRIIQLWKASSSCCRLFMRVALLNLIQKGNKILFPIKWDPKHIMSVIFLFGSYKSYIAILLQQRCIEGAQASLCATWSQLLRFDLILHRFPNLLCLNIGRVYVSYIKSIDLIRKIFDWRTELLPQHLRHRGLLGSWAAANVD